MLSQNSSIQELRKLSRSLEILSLKLASGMTLEAALRANTPFVKVPKALALQWIWMRDSIIEGHIPPKFGVEIFLQLVRTHELCLAQSRKHGLNAKIQSRVLVVVTILAMIASCFFVEAPLVSKSNLIAFALVGIGFAWLLKIEKALSKNLWRLEWMILWFYVRALTECGITPAQAFSQSLQWCPLSKAVPKELAVSCRNLLQSLRRGEAHAVPAMKPSRSLDTMDTIIIDQFAQATNEGIQSSVVVKNYGEQYARWLQESLIEKAERSAFLNLLPLYLCFAPAIFWTLLSPILNAYLSKGF